MEFLFAKKKPPECGGRQKQSLPTQLQPATILCAPSKLKYLGHNSQLLLLPLPHFPYVISNFRPVLPTTKTLTLHSKQISLKFIHWKPVHLRVFTRPYPNTSLASLSHYNFGLLLPNGLPDGVFLLSDPNY
ncbi:hypothetical protein DSO57_1008084 [Entomophthora muscae]|uniref:Uncharacterized protein n=1 Tax=Entomophthora muscae TaxID=34485 RepID=A0ACC2RYC8_9FUNG|nr:hypothetical protein DSO57_1008084 [Entomophthora muscae]